MKVKIISGSYGWRPDKGDSVEPVPKGSTCEVSDAEAARLVALEVAVYADAPVQAPGVPRAPSPGGEEEPVVPRDTHGADPTTEDATGGEESGSADAEVAKLERMSRADLESMARDMGVDLDRAKNKHDLAVLIAAAEDPEDGEVLPDLEAGDIVQ